MYLFLLMGEAKAYNKDWSFFALLALSGEVLDLEALNYNFKSTKLLSLQLLVIRSS